MAHRTGSGQKVKLAEFSQECRAKGNSPSTYCNLGEYDAFVENFGELVVEHVDARGVTWHLRRHATVKTSRDKRRIAHNSIISGPLSTPIERWTFYPDSYFERVRDRLLAS